jgi:hypothetical protein
MLEAREFSPQILVLQNSLKFAFLPTQTFYNFLGIFRIFSNYFSHPNFLIYFPKSRNQFRMDFIFRFFSSQAGPPTPLALACQPTHATQPTSPLLASPAQRHPSLPDRRAPPTFVLLRPSRKLEPRHLMACTTAAPEPPWLCPPLVQDHPPSTIKPQPLPPPPLESEL